MIPGENRHNVVVPRERPAVKAPQSIIPELPVLRCNLSRFIGFNTSLFMQNQLSCPSICFPGQVEGSVHQIRHAHGGIGDLHLTAPAASNFEAVGQEEPRFPLPGSHSEWQVVRQTVFGFLRETDWIEGCGQDIGWPVTLLSTGTKERPREGGTYVQAVKGAGVRILSTDGRVSGVVYEDAHGRYCFLGGLVPTDKCASPNEQTLQVFERMAGLLDLAGMDFSNVVRTWFYLDAILDWYGEFNRARDKFFSNRHLFDSILPASTGIGAKNGYGSALVAEALAVQPKSNKLEIRQVASPLQGSACDYGSSFSRAVELVDPDHTRLFVSGTASIAPKGQSLHSGDVDAQVRLTMSIVDAILKSCDMDWQHSCRAFAYFKHAGDFDALNRYCASAGISWLPVLLYENDICRPELLFEIELDAVKAGTPTKITKNEETGFHK